MKKPVKKKEGGRNPTSKDKAGTQTSTQPHQTPSTPSKSISSPTQPPGTPLKQPPTQPPLTPSPKPLKLRAPDPEDFSEDEETVPIKRRWNLSEKRPTVPPTKRQATAQTAGRKKARLTNTADIEEKQAEAEDSSDWESDPQNEVTVLMDKFKTILSTPKIKGISTESSPSSNGSESDDDLDDPSILAVQQAFTSE